MRHLIGTLSVALVSLSASASDDLFGAYEGGDLDEYACYDQGRIEFDVPIDRVISRDKTGWSDLFLSRPVLRMAVYDVDDDDLSFGCAERDEVYVNDVFVGTLSGANDTWSEFNIELPPEMWDPIHGAVRDATFVAPGVSPTPGVNHVRIEIDTSGCRHWCVEVNYAEISVDAVRPVTFIHGILSSAATWDDVLPLVPGSDGLAYDVGPRASTGHNGPLVSRAIEQTLTGFGVDRTNLVCHSKGGLDAEWASLTSGAQIESLVTLGSPLQGSEMADHFLYDHGSLMLISALMGSYHTAMSLATFTRERLYETFGSTEIPGIHYHHLAGVADAPDLVGCPLNAVHLPSVFPFRVAHDGYVGCDRASPAWGSLDTTAGVEHVDMTSSAALWGWAWDRILGGDAGSVACAGPTRSLAATTVQLPGTRGSLAPGGEREAVLSIDGSVDAFSISALTADPGVALTLTDPAGAAWSAGRPGGGLSWTSVEVVPGALYAVGASAQAPAAGAWTATT
ncbi:MAG TPA: hypothetical protein PKA64_26450, partial [Myxococcota bacterium]|nr:hypothetical protein [Myxococcota bacterium]